MSFSIVVLSFTADSLINPCSATLTASASSSTVAPENSTLQPTYAGIPVFLARALATLVAKSMLPVTVYKAVHNGSEGWKRWRRIRSSAQMQFNFNNYIYLRARKESILTLGIA